VRRYLDDTTCAAAIRSLVTSRVDYVNALLYGLPDCALRKLQVLQNDAARVLTGTSRREHISPIMQQLHWLPIRQRITHKILCTVYKCLHDAAAPGYLKDTLQPRLQSRTLRSSGSLQLHAPRTCTQYGSRAFSVCGPILWNSLPMSIRNSQTVSAFHKNIKKPCCSVNTTSDSAPG